MNDGWNSSPSGWNVFDSQDFDDHTLDGVDLRKFDNFNLIAVLAGGLDNMGKNHPWVADRLDAAYQLYRIKKRKILILGGGTYHKPPHRNRQNFVIHESTMGAKYLCDLGVQPADIYREWASYDTIANAFFALLNFVYPMQESQLLVITSDFHMARASTIFDKLFSLWGDSGSGQTVEIHYVSVSTKYLDSELFESRSAREKKSLESLNQLFQKVTTWSDFHRWFFTEHKAYNCELASPHSEKIDEKTRATY